MKNTFASIAAIAVVLAISGCRRPHQTVVVDRPEDSPAPARTVVIEQAHTHAAGCDHYYHNGRWYSDAAHVHVIE